MNSTELRYILCDSIPSKFETGVFACDQLNNVVSDSFAIICNNQDSTLPGQHWLAFYKSSIHNSTEMFDSFAMSVKFYPNYISAFLKSKGSIVIKNKCQVQSNFSNYCGQFCVYFLLKRIQGLSFSTIMNLFSADLSKNDRVVDLFVKTNFYEKQKHSEFCKCNHKCNNVLQCSKKKNKLRYK